MRKGSWISFLLRICQLRKQQQEARKTVPEDGNMLAVSLPCLRLPPTTTKLPVCSAMRLSASREVS